MIVFDEFINTTRKYFDFLEHDHGYVFQNSDTVPFIHYIDYRKENTIVRISLGYRHDYLEVYIFFKVNKFQPNTQDLKHSESLLDLIYKKKGRSFNHETDYDLYMPSKIGLINSLDKVADLFKVYASKVL